MHGLGHFLMEVLNFSVNVCHLLLSCLDIISSLIKIILILRSPSWWLLFIVRLIYRSSWIFWYLHRFFFHFLFYFIFFFLNFLLIYMFFFLYLNLLFGYWCLLLLLFLYRFILHYFGLSLHVILLLLDSIFIFFVSLMLILLLSNFLFNFHSCQGNFFGCLLRSIGLCLLKYYWFNDFWNSFRFWGLNSCGYRLLFKSFLFFLLLLKHFLCSFSSYFLLLFSLLFHIELSLSLSLC